MNNPADTATVRSVTAKRIRQLRRSGHKAQAQDTLQAHKKLVSFFGGDPTALKVREPTKFHVQHGG